MEVLLRDLESDVTSLIRDFESSQWKHVNDPSTVSGLPVKDRESLRSTKMEKLLYHTKTSGSTGEPVTVQKTYLDRVWYLATNAREFLWRKWDFTRKMAVVKPGLEEHVLPSWGVPRAVAPVQGDTHVIGMMGIYELQKWLERVSPDYLQCLPSIKNLIDFTRLPRMLDWKGTGECGGTMFSSEECGTIAITCPDNPSVYHVMENQIVEVDDDGGMIISTMTNPYVRRYKNGDHIELGSCGCGRSLQTITRIRGRVRNMFVMPNGDRKWPLVGSRDYYDEFGIKRFKAIQTSLRAVELQIVSENLGDREAKVKELCRQSLGCDVEVSIKYVTGFPDYKFEEFVCMVNT